MIVAIMTVHSAFGFFMNWSGAQKGGGFEYHLLVIAMAAFLMIRGPVPSRLIAPLRARGESTVVLKGRQKRAGIKVELNIDRERYPEGGAENAHAQRTAYRSTIGECTRLIFISRR